MKAEQLSEIGFHWEHRSKTTWLIWEIARLPLMMTKG